MFVIVESRHANIYAILLQGSRQARESLVNMHQKNLQNLEPAETLFNVSCASDEATPYGTASICSPTQDYWAQVNRGDSLDLRGPAPDWETVILPGWDRAYTPEYVPSFFEPQRLPNITSYGGLSDFARKLAAESLNLDIALAENFHRRKPWTAYSNSLDFENLLEATPHLKRTTSPKST